MTKESYTRLEAKFIRCNRRRIFYTCPYVEHRDFFGQIEAFSSPIELSGQLDSCPICGKKFIVPENESIKTKLQAKAEKERLKAEAEKERLRAEAEKERLRAEAEKERLRDQAEKERLRDQAEKDAAIVRERAKKAEEADPMLLPKFVTTFILIGALIGSFQMIFGAEGDSLVFYGGVVSLKLWSLAGCFFWILFTIEKNTRAK